MTVLLRASAVLRLQHHRGARRPVGPLQKPNNHKNLSLKHLFENAEWDIRLTLTDRALKRGQTA